MSSMYNADNPATMIAQRLMNESSAGQTERLLQEQKKTRAHNISNLTESVRKQVKSMTVTERQSFIADIQK